MIFIMFGWFLTVVASYSLASKGIFDYYYHFAKHCGFSPTQILDVGANQGEWTKKLLKLYPQSSFFLIDGNPQNAPYLQSLNLSLETILIGDSSGHVNNYMQRGTPLVKDNFLFREKTDLFQDPVMIEVPITTIDEIVQRRVHSRVQLVRLDIQGGELNALRGAQNTLFSVEVLQVACPLLQFREGAPIFREVFNYLQLHEFDLYGIVEIVEFDGLPIKFDALFVRRSSSLWTKECTHLTTSTTTILTETTNIHERQKKSKRFTHQRRVQETAALPR